MEMEEGDGANDAPLANLASLGTLCQLMEGEIGNFDKSMKETEEIQQ